MHKVSLINIAPAMAGLSHGTHAKDMFVCHESVSYNSVGLGDIEGLESVLHREGYGIHGITDLEGHKGWARGHGNDIFWHAGGVNTRAVGVENISEIPILIQAKKLTNEQAYHLWLHRSQQLTALAILMACWHNADQHAHRLIRSDGNSPGVCSHWDVSQHFTESEGHWDCHPYDKGGHFPLAHVIDLAKVYATQYEF